MEEVFLKVSAGETTGLEEKPKHQTEVAGQAVRIPKVEKSEGKKERKLKKKK